MPDLDQQKTGITGAAPAGRDGRGRFRRGGSGNPAGRPRGSLNRATRAAAVLLDGAAEALTRKAVELALGGDPAALRLCLERIIGVRRGRPVELALPPLVTAVDLAAAMAAIMAAVAEGAVTPDEALALVQMLERFPGTLKAVHEEVVRNYNYAQWRHSSGGPPEAYAGRRSVGVKR